jgi:isopenicillin N synthase-like dioxygenase
MQDFPIVDISSYRSDSMNSKQSLARTVDEVCRQTGFLAIVGHGIPSQTTAAAWHAGRCFFDLPLEQKLEVGMPYSDYPYGYAPLRTEMLAGSIGKHTPPDLKESFSIGPLRRSVDSSVDDDQESVFRYAPNQWPRKPAELRAAWSAYYEEMEKLAATMMRIFALALELPENFFADKIDRHTSAMRALNYPDLSAPPVPGQLRAGEHSDYGSLTILLTEPAPGGLEIFTADRTWLEVPVVEGSLIINIGDLMARWTNDRWVSTLHRVRCPPADWTGTTRRQSIAFFHQPNWDAEISCIPTCLGIGGKAKYEPVRSGAYLMEKFRLAVSANH